MTLENKTLRYYYWIIREFTKKHLRLILISFFISFFIVITLISFTPYLASLLAAKHETIGVAGDYNTNALPLEIRNKISHGLIAVNEKGDVTPALASSWEAKNNAKEFRFHLKKNLFWDDGEPFTARDIQYQFKDIEIVPVDTYTVDFKLKKPLAIFPIYLANPVFKKPLHGVVGQYKVDRIKSKYGVINELELSPNKGNLPSITYKFYESESKLINAYKKGEVAQIIINNRNLAESFKTWKNTEIIRSTDYSKILTLFLNLRNDVFQSKEVRQALAASIPREDFEDDGEVADSPIPPNSWGYNPNLKKSVYNPDLAKKTITKNESTASAKLDFRTYYDYLEIASEINTHLQKAGFNTKLSLGYERDNKYDLLLTFWELNPDPDQYLFWHSTQIEPNITGYKNVKVDKLLEDGRSIISASKRKSFYNEFQKVIIDDTPAVFIYYPYLYTVKRK